MSFKYWVFVLGLLASLKPLSEVLPLLRPWLRQGWTTVSQVGQARPGTPAPTDSNKAPQSGEAAPDVLPQTPPTPQAAAPPTAADESAQPYTWQSTPNDRLGALVNSELVVQIVEPLSPAEEAGLNGGDKLLAVNGKPLHGLKELQAVLSHKPAQVVLRVKLFISETGAQQDITVKLRPDAKAAL